MRTLTLLLTLASSSPTAAFVTVNTTQLGQCFSPYVYTLLLNAASNAQSLAKAELANSTVRFPDGSFHPAEFDVRSDDLRLDVETGSRVTTIITLIVIGGVSLALLTVGEALVNTVTVLTAVLASFMGSLYVFQWACSSTAAPMDGWVKCLLPFILACVCALLAAAIVICLLRRLTSVVFFVMGAAGGAFACFLLRQLLLAADPDLAAAAALDYYWLVLAAISLLCGLLAVRLKAPVVRAVTCALGGYALAVALCGLVPACGGPYVANYVFFLVAALATAGGLAFQCFCGKASSKSPHANKGRVGEAHGRKNERDQKAQKNRQVAMNRHAGDNFVAP